MKPSRTRCSTKSRTGHNTRIISHHELDTGAIACLNHPIAFSRGAGHGLVHQNRCTHFGSSQNHFQMAVCPPRPHDDDLRALVVQHLAVVLIESQGPQAFCGSPQALRIFIGYGHDVESGVGARC